jgi:hypothetical protein
MKKLISLFLILIFAGCVSVSKQIDNIHQLNKESSSLLKIIKDNCIKKFIECQKNNVVPANCNLGKKCVVIFNNAYIIMNKIDDLCIVAKTLIEAGKKSEAKSKLKKAKELLNVLLDSLKKEGII